MENSYDYKKFAVLYVDDEDRSLTNFTRAFSDTFRILTASSAQEGFKLFEEHADEIGILMTDQRMPGEKGVWLLERARQLRPRVLRMLVTAFSDMDAAIAAVNEGAIYKYLNKPWDPAQLEMTLRQGLEFFMVQAERDQLLQEKMSVLRNMMIADRIVSLGLLAAGLSHHIRNSMVAVKTFLELAPIKMAEERDSSNAGLRDPDFWREYHSNVQGQIEKVNVLLADLRTAAEAGKSSDPFADEIQLKSALDLRLEALAGERFILYPRAIRPGLSDEIVEACRSCGFEPKVVQEAPQLSSTINLVATGMGVSIVPDGMRHVRARDVRYVPFQGLPVKAHLALAGRAKTPSPLTANFRQTLLGLVSRQPDQDGPVLVAG